MNPTDLQSQLQLALRELETIKADLAGKSLEEKAQLRAAIEQTLAAVDDNDTRTAVRGVLDSLLVEK